MMAIQNCQIWHQKSFNWINRAWRRLLSQRLQLFWTRIQDPWDPKPRAPKSSRTVNFKEHRSRLIRQKTLDSTLKWKLTTIEATSALSTQNQKKISLISHRRKSLNLRMSMGTAHTISTDMAMAPYLTPRIWTQTDTKAWGLRRERESQRLYRRQLTLQKIKRITFCCKVALWEPRILSN